MKTAPVLSEAPAVNPRCALACIVRELLQLTERLEVVHQQLDDEGIDQACTAAGKGVPREPIS